VSRITIALIAFIFASLPIGPVAEAAEIKVFALQSPQIVINEVGADFERSTGHKITQLLRRTDMPPEATRRIDAGETFDVAFVLPPMIEQLIKEEKIVAVTRTHCSTHRHRRGGASWRFQA
jgi:ABC-type molybdate transport system substrate-binding protein